MKVYVVVVEVLIAGAQVPVILLFDVVGKVNVPPLQIAATCVNVGVTDGFTVKTIFALHPLLFVYVIVELPWITPVTSPLETLAILGALDNQGLVDADVPLPVNWELLPTQITFRPEMVGIVIALRTAGMDAADVQELAVTVKV